MRLAARPLLATLLAGTALLVPAGPSGAHGGAELAAGGRDGVSIRLNAAASTTPDGADAVDLATTLVGPGTGEGATVTLWIRPAGGRTFRATTERDAAGIAHTEVPTAGRGEWRDWDVSAVVDLSTGERLRVSNAEANPPGPDPASTPGGGATGAEPGEATTAGDAPASGGTRPGTATEGAPGPAPTTATGQDPAAAGGTVTSTSVEDVSGEDDAAPGWVLPSAVVLVALALALVVVRRRRRGPLDPGE